MAKDYYTEQRKEFYDELAKIEAERKAEMKQEGA